MYNRIAGYKQYYKSLVMLGVPIIIGQLGAISGTTQYGGTSGGIVRQ